MPQFYGSQRLFWYLIVAMTLNSASLVVLGPNVVSTPLTRAGRLVGTLAATVEVRVEESR